MGVPDVTALIAALLQSSHFIVIVLFSICYYGNNVSNATLPNYITYSGKFLRLKIFKIASQS